MSTVNDQETQAFIELLYERSGRTNGLFTGLYQQWAMLTLKAARTAQLDEHLGRGRDSRTPWFHRYFAAVQGEDGASNSCVDG